MPHLRSSFDPERSRGVPAADGCRSTPGMATFHFTRRRVRGQVRSRVLLVVSGPVRADEVMPTVLRAQQLQGKRHLDEHPEERVHAFNYAFESRRIYRLDGPEHGGKHLLWRLLTLLDRPAGGELVLGEAVTTRLSDQGLAELRNREVGYVFPTPYLLPGFTVVENVAMPLFKVLQVDPAEAKKITEEVLALTGLTDVGDETLDGLSALQQHVAALARAVIHGPL